MRKADLNELFGMIRYLANDCPDSMLSIEAVEDETSRVNVLQINFSDHGFYFCVNIVPNGMIHIEYHSENLDLTGTQMTWREFITMTINKYG
jgi:hypothetical protein